MRAVLQRVKQAHVDVDGKIVGSIQKGLLVFLGVGKNDDEKSLSYTLEKIINLRIFEDDQGKMNLSLLDVAGEMLVVSQFTLYGDCRKGRRPGFSDSAPPDMANAMYEKFVQAAKAKGITTQTGIFGAMMDVSLVNDGPVTMLIDSDRTF